ncbi:MAG: L-fucose:H+ symporter permease [Cyclobacteriaceae bacterium]|jgi:FHS family L-fucose permease-like MFS transporter
MTKIEKRDLLFPFILVTSLFFLWAFVHNLEPILIPHLKKACQLSDFQSALIDSAVYFGYFLMALPAGMVMKKFGYKKGILAGLILYAVGALLFIPAADSRMYALFLTALFIIASGCAFLETAANPYITLLGKPETATARLNLAQSFNGFGAFIAPYAGGLWILSGVEYTNEEMASFSSQDFEQYLQMEADAVKIPYLIIALTVFLVAVLIWATKMPEASEESSTRPSGIVKALRHRHLRWGVLTQFFYVGAQVCVTSFFIRFARQASDIPEKDAAFWLSMAMLGFMIGRFAGTFFMRFVSAPKLLTLYSFICMVLLLVASLANGPLAVWALMAVPFFESILFPTIFSLAIQNLKEDTPIGSSLVVMSIAGGAFFPLLMGFISDQSQIQWAYLVPAACFLVVAWYGWSGHQVVSEDNPQSSL